MSVGGMSVDGMNVDGMNVDGIKVDGIKVDGMMCHRCSESFETRNDLIVHWKTSVPCDYVCPDCGIRLQNKRAYQRHRKAGEECKYIPKEDILDKIFESNKISTKIKQPPKKSPVKTPKSITNIHNHHGDNVKNTNNISINIDMRGMGMILKHTEEMKINKEELLGEIVEKILFRMDKGISGKADWGQVAFSDSFHQMFAHIYANKQRPEYHNLLLKDEVTRELQVFNGETFVDDKLTSEERMLKVLNFIGDGLRWMVENCDNYSEQDKEEKRDRIGRVISGIPRFKMTYKAMFDNIFDSLKDVREEILKTIDEPKVITDVNEGV